MSNLDPQYMIAPSLQEAFIDKTTGLPLSNGKVYFWSDNSRITPKPIFTLTGTPGTYSYVELPNPVPLTSVGTLSDGFNNDIIPYYFPFDEDGNVELYFIQVYNSDGVFQFSRQAWPNLSGTGSNSVNLFNYIPNGQFALHNDIAADPVLNYPIGRITQPETIVAQGGWVFSRPVGSTAIDIVTFDRIGSYVTNPTSSPRYALRLQTLSPGGSDNFKYLSKVFGDVNKFASDTQEYTFALEAINNSAGSIDATILFIKNFGTGGSAPVIQTLATFSITTSYQIFQTTFIAGDNSSYTIGPDDDDYCAIVVSYSTTFSQDISLTDVIFTDGDVSVTEFPIVSNEDFITRSNITPIPKYDGSTLGLPLIQTKRGIDTDFSSVGDVVASFEISKDWHFLCDGSQYLTAGYQSTGVPNSRLQKVLFDNTSNCPLFGTGTNFAQFSSTSSNNNILRNNNKGPVPATADGSVATGFTFYTSYSGFSALGYSYNSTGYTSTTGNIIVIENDGVGQFQSVDVGGTGFSINTSVGYNRSGSPISKMSTALQVTNAVPGLASQYFRFYNTGVVTGYAVWFTVDGVGSAPSLPGYILIQVNLRSFHTAAQVATIICNAINNHQTTSIVFTSGLTIPAGSYFTFSTLGLVTTNYYIWYMVDGIGTDPLPIGATGIPISILSTSTALEVEKATKIALNSLYFCVPNLYDNFLTMANPIGLLRISKYIDVPSSKIGTYQLDNNLSHLHSTQILSPNLAPFPVGNSGFDPLIPVPGLIPSAYILPYINQNVDSGFTGGPQSNPKNTAINFFIKY